LTPGRKAIAWIEDSCVIPEGRHVGRPVKLRPWQKRIIRSLYDRKTRRAIITFGRKNGKTSLVH
jgi:phage terminase large subunit-like protein